MTDYSLKANLHFKGAELSALNCDKFAKASIEDDMLKEDLGYMDTKWWDYRTMHPSKATLFFFHLYLHMATEYIAKNINVRESQRWQASIPGRDLRNTKASVVRAFWKARMAADALGVPYDRYLRIAFQNFYDGYHSFATTADGTQRVPYPLQLTSGIVMEKVQRDWQAECKARVRMPESELILGQQVWFRPQMEEWIRDTARQTEYEPDFLRIALRCGAILPSQDTPA